MTDYGHRGMDFSYFPKILAIDLLSFGQATCGITAQFISWPLQCLRIESWKDWRIFWRLSKVWYPSCLEEKKKSTEFSWLINTPMTLDFQGVQVCRGWYCVVSPFWCVPTYICDVWGGKDYDHRVHADSFTMFNLEVVTLNLLRYTFNLPQCVNVCLCFLWDRSQLCP